MPAPPTAPRSDPHSQDDDEEGPPVVEFGVVDVGIGSADLPTAVEETAADAPVAVAAAGDGEPRSA